MATKKSEIIRDIKDTLKQDKTDMLADIYDVKKMAVSVHSQELAPEINEDLTLSNSDPEVLNNPILNFVRERLKALMLLKVILQDKQPILEGPALDAYNSCKRIIMTEIMTIVIGSRGHMGKTITSLLQLGIEQNREEMEQEPERKPTIMERLRGRPNEKQR